MFHVKPWLLAALLLPSVAEAASSEVRFPGPGLELVGRLYLPEGVAKAPAVVLLHGCSGLWARNGQPTKSYQAWAEHLQRRGFAALLVDSFGPRGEREICTQKERRISEARDRPRDAHAALRWLASRPDIRAESIHVLGWSNGGTTALHALRSDAPGRESLGPGFRSGVAFYPGCAAISRGAYRPEGALLIQAGGADDWTPARHCEKLVGDARGAGATAAIDVYAGAHHGFDRVDGTLRHRPEVRNASSPTGWGATVGPNPIARAGSLERATKFLEAQR